LAYGVHAHLLRDAVVVPEAARDALEEALRIGHVAVVRENPLRGDVRERDDAAPFVERIEVLRHRERLVQADGTHVERGLQPAVVDVGVVLALAHVRAHADAVQDKIDLPSKMLHRPFKQRSQILDAGGIRGNDGSAADLGGEVVNFAHPHGHRGVREDDFSALRMGLQRGFPRDALVVQGTEDDAFFAFEEVVGHGLIVQVLGQFEGANLGQIGMPRPSLSQTR